MFVKVKNEKYLKINFVRSDQEFQNKFFFF